MIDLQIDNPMPMPFVFVVTKAFEQLTRRGRINAGSRITDDQHCVSGFGDLR